MPKGPHGEKRPVDANQLAKLVVDIATKDGEPKDVKPKLGNKTRKKR